MAPSSQVPKVDGEPFQCMEMRQTPQTQDISLCPDTKMPCPFWRVFKEWAPPHFRSEILLLGNGNLDFG